MRRRSRVPTVKKAVNEFVRRLRGAARPAVARQSLKYFKPGDSIYVCGVKTPEVRKFARELYRRVEGDWGIGDALEFCDSMVWRRELESKALGFFLLSHFRDEFRSDLLRRAEGWVVAQLCENWAAVDTLCGAITSPVLAEESSHGYESQEDGQIPKYVGQENRRRNIGTAGTQRNVSG